MSEIPETELPRGVSGMTGYVPPPGKPRYVTIIEDKDGLLQLYDEVNKIIGVVCKQRKIISICKCGYHCPATIPDPVYMDNENTKDVDCRETKNFWVPLGKPDPVFYTNGGVPYSLWRAHFR